jgi:hypothetical protein
VPFLVPVSIVIAPPFLRIIMSALRGTLVLPRGAPPSRLRCQFHARETRWPIYPWQNFGVQIH